MPIAMEEMPNKCTGYIGMPSDESWADPFEQKSYIGVGIDGRLVVELVGETGCPSRISAEEFQEEAMGAYERLLSRIERSA